jgi:predicted Holliday junction resolvase-like endonuclease
MNLTLLFFIIFCGIFVFIILLNKKIKQIKNSNAKKEEKLQNQTLIKEDKDITNTNLIKNINYPLSENIQNYQETKDEKIDEEPINEVFQNGFNVRDGILYTEILNKKYF